MKNGGCMYQRISRLVVAILFFGSEMIMAQNISQSNQQVQQNVEPNENCQPTANLGTDDNGNSMYDYAYHACLGRNAKKDQLRAYMNQGAADAQSINNGRPTPPPPHNCGDQSTASDPFTYSSCINAYENSPAMQDYKRKLQAYNDAASEEQKSQAEAAKKAAEAKLSDRSVTGSLSEIQQKNQEGNQLYKMAGVALAGVAAYKFASGQTCYASCAAFGSGCCSAAPLLMAAGAAFMLLNSKANKQADEHAGSAIEACQKFNQLSSTQKDCSSIVDTTTPPVTTIYDDNGKCKPTAPPGCVDLNSPGNGSGPSVTKVPTNCTSNGKPVSCLAAGSNAFIKNPDGSISVKTPNGLKTYTDKDFADVKSMMAAGMSAADANKLFSDLYGKDSLLSKAGADAKSLAELGKDKKNLGDFSGLGGGASTVAVDGAANSNKKFSEKIGDVADRRPTSEGLTRDFNGELIGAAGDDIFTMMNRRYKLKNEQDSFIAP